jgi:hypothetical protein
MDEGIVVPAWLWTLVEGKYDSRNILKVENLVSVPSRFNEESPRFHFRPIISFLPHACLSNKQQSVE